MNKKNVLTVKNLNKVYSKNGSEQIRAINNLNLEVKEGEIFGLLGPNGAGKSTFINIIAGLCNKSFGKVFVCGLNLDDDPKTIKGNIEEAAVNLYSMLRELDEHMPQRIAVANIPNQGIVEAINYRLKMMVRHKMIRYLLANQIQHQILMRYPITLLFYHQKYLANLPII